MKSFIAAATTLFFAATAVAGPIKRDTPTVPFVLQDFNTGASATYDVPLDGVDHSLLGLFIRSRLEHGGSILATHATIFAPGNNHPLCVIKSEDGAEVGRLYFGTTGTKENINFGQADNGLDRVNVGVLQINCQQGW